MVFLVLLSHHSNIKHKIMKTIYKKVTCYPVAVIGLLMACFALLPGGNEALAQPTNKINYQAVARNITGNVLQNQNIGLRISILNGSGGPSLYTETFNLNTNNFGLFTVQLGGGVLVSGNYNTINWSQGNQWLKVEMDPTGGNSYVNMGESQLLSVPYALYAANGLAAGSAAGNTPYWNGTAWVDSSNIYNNGGDVGIGTATPSSKLDIYKDFASSNIIENTLNLIRGTTGTAANGIGNSMSFWNETSNAGFSISSRINSLFEDAAVGVRLAAMDFKVRNDASVNSVMYLKGDGRVGINNNAPASALHAYTQFDGDGLYMQPVTAGHGLGMLLFNTVDLVATLGAAGTAGNWVPTSVANDVILKNSRPNSLIFGTNDTEQMRIDNSGNVGIGTTSPDRKLKVISSTTAAGQGVIHGEFTGVGNIGAYGVYGKSAPADYAGYGGFFVGGYQGAHGTVNATGSDFYYGLNGSATGGATGAAKYGVYGTAVGGTGTNNYGVFGSASGGANNYAGYFLNGDVYIFNSLGIGITAPDANTKVHVIESTVSAMMLGTVSGSLSYLTVNKPSTSNSLEIFRARDDGTTVATFNEVADTYQLTVYGDALASGGTWVNSDHNIKRDIGAIDNALHSLMSLKPASYYFDNKKEQFKYLNLPDELQFGLIAQDVKNVFPNIVREAVQYAENGNPGSEKLHSVNYTALIPVLIKGIQEQQKMIEQLKTEIELLKAGRQVAK
jgi:hypothetical protein